MIDVQLALRVLVELRQLRGHERWSRKRIEAYQTKQLQNLRGYVYAHSPFYQQFHRKFMESRLEELPILTKAILMENFDELVTDRAVKLKDVQAYVARGHPEERFLERLWVTATSGSSGHPGFFVFNKAEWIHVMASFARTQEWAGLGLNPLHHTKMATVASPASWHMSGQVGATIGTSWMPEIQISASDPLPSIVERLNNWQPEVLIAYASMAFILAEEQLSGRLHITPRFIFTSSEVLTTAARQRIETAWGKRLFNEYAATETATIAAECEQHQGLHLFEDLLIVEVVDENNRVVPIGTYGDKLLVTVLFNRTQPLIRYELTDSIQLAPENCSCSLPFQLIQGVQGRTEDTLHLPASDGSMIAIHPIVFHRVMDIIRTGEWQIIYAEQGLTVLLSGAGDNFAASEVVNAIQKELTAQGVIIPTIRVQQVSSIPKSASGKTPLIQSQVHHP